MPAIDEATMQSQIPEHVRQLLVEHRAREEENERREREVDRRARAAEQQRQRRNAQLAKPVLAFARKLAETGLLPSSGIEIFRSHTGRFTNGAHVYPDGSLCVWTGSYMGGGSWRGRTPGDFAPASDRLLRELAHEVERGTVWEHIRDPPRR